jgi:fused signal recognition particle receptor
MPLEVGILILIVVAAILGGAAFYLRRSRRAPLDYRGLEEVDRGPEAQTTAPPRPGRTKPAPTAPVAPSRKSLGDRLAKTRDSLGVALRGVFGSGRLDGAFWEGIEDALVSADVGVSAAVEVVDAVKRANPETPDAARSALRAELLAVLDRPARALVLEGSPATVVVVGVNGAGKTTTIAKLAARMRESGHSPILGAADTFRAAADEQLRTWAGRVDVEVVGGEPGADPASVAYDALQTGRLKGNDVVIVDTAGRLQNKKNLMDELGKIVRVIERDSDPVSEVLLVIDATTGQNGLSQAKQFTEVVGVTGIVLTKLDGTARGGVVVAIERELDIPVKYIGVGEGVDDLIEFEPEAFIDALLGAGA